MDTSMLRPAPLRRQPGCLGHPLGCDAHPCPLCGTLTHGAYSDLLPHRRLRICVACQEERSPTEAYARYVARRERRRPA